MTGTIYICVAIQLGLSLFSKLSYQRCGMALSHDLVLDTGLTSLRPYTLGKIVQEKLLCLCLNSLNSLVLLRSIPGSTMKPIGLAHQSLDET